MLINILYAIIATLGFCIIFNIKGKNLYFAPIGGGLGWLFYLICQNANLTETTSNFAASIAIGIYSEIMARINKTPVTTFEICALIPLVPGGGMYNTMVYSIKGNIYSALETGLNTMSNAGALAMGLILVSSISKIVTSLVRKRKNNNFS